MTFHSGTYLGQHYTPRRTEMSDDPALPCNQVLVTN